MILCGWGLRKCRFRPAKSRLDYPEVTVKDRMEQRWLPGHTAKPLAWDVAIPDTCAASHIRETANFAGVAAEKASDNKKIK